MYEIKIIVKVSFLTIEVIYLIHIHFGKIENEIGIYNT